MSDCVAQIVITKTASDTYRIVLMSTTATLDVIEFVSADDVMKYIRGEMIGMEPV